MNKKQNDFVEKLAKDAAAANRPADWRLTPISEKSAARITCPFRNNGFVPDGGENRTSLARRNTIPRSNGTGSLSRVFEAKQA